MSPFTKWALIKIVVRALEGSGASAKVQGGAHRANTMPRLSARRAKFSGHLGDKFPPIGVASKEYLFEAVAVGELFEYGAGNPRSCRSCIKLASTLRCRRNCAGSCGQHGSRGETLSQRCRGVVAVTGAFETMNDYDDRRFLALARLPVAMSEQAGFGIDLKQPGLSGREIESAWQEGGSDGHGVAVFQE